MADNAIEKLFEEMRAAKAGHDDAIDRLNNAKEAADRAHQDRVSAHERVRLLQRTLEKHVHEGLPIVQAKMQAHEEEVDQPTTIYGENIVAGSITTNRISVGAISNGKLTSSI